MIFSEDIDEFYSNQNSNEYSFWVIKIYIIRIIIVKNDFTKIKINVMQ